MDNPYPLESLKHHDDSSSEEEDDEVWDMHSNSVTRTDVFGAFNRILSFYGPFSS